MVHNTKLKVKVVELHSKLTRPAPELSAKEREQVKKAARELLVKLNGLLATHVNWRQKTSARSRFKLEIENTLDDELPRAYDKDLFEIKCASLFQHFFECYPEQGVGGVCVTDYRNIRAS